MGGAGDIKTKDCKAAKLITSMSKLERLKRIATESGKLTIAAIDHRGLLKKMLHPENPEQTSENEIKTWKQTMVDVLAENVSGLLIDPTYGRDLVDTRQKCGWILSMEQTGYRGGQQARITELIPNWSVVKAKELGASGVKLLLYYDPNNTMLAKQQHALAAKVAQECQEAKMIFLLEPLSYRRANEPYLVERMVDELLDLPVDIFKLEYPGDQDKCRRISQKLSVPWVLLSAGAEYNEYRQQLRVAMEAGASGMAVGRALWQEFGQYGGEERAKFFRETVTARVRELTSVVEGK